MADKFPAGLTDGYRSKIYGNGPEHNDFNSVIKMRRKEISFRKQVK